MTKITCDRCRGQKKVMGMGCMEVECEKCFGVGYVEATIIQSRLHQDDEAAPTVIANEGATIIIDDPLNPETTTSDPVRRRGRPKKSEPTTQENQCIPEVEGSHTEESKPDSGDVPNTEVP